MSLPLLTVYLHKKADACQASAFGLDLGELKFVITGHVDAGRSNGRLG